MTGDELISVIDFVAQPDKRKQTIFKIMLRLGINGKMQLVARCAQFFAMMPAVEEPSNTSTL